MAAENILLKTTVDLGNSTNSVKSLKAELRQVTNELATLEEGSAAFVNAAKRAGELKDKIGDVKDTINAFNPEKKFQAIADSVGIAANGFAALQGGMALFGSESEDLQKVMAKTQGAIALATGLNGLLGMGDALKNLKLTTYSAISGLSGMITGVGGLGGALNALKTTLLTNPLFVLASVIVAIGVSLKGFYDGLSSGVEIYKSSAKAVADLKKSYTSLIDEIKTLQIENDLANGKITQKDADLLKQKNNFKKDYLKILDDANTKESEIRKQASKERDDDGFKGTKNLLDKLGIETATTKAAKQSIESIEKQKQENIAALKKKYSLINTNIIIEDTKNEIKDNITKNEKIKANQKRIDDWNKKKQEDEEKLLEAKKRQQEELIARTEKEYSDTNKLTDEFYKKEELALIRSGASEEESKKSQQEIDIKNIEQKIQNAKDYGQSTTDLELQLEKKKTDIKNEEATKQADINKKIAADETLTSQERFDALDALNKKHVISDKEASDAKIAIAKAEKDAKSNVLDAYSNVLNQASELAGKNTEEGKIMAIAAATIQTYLGAARAMASAEEFGPVYAAIATAAAIASGLAQVNAIMNVQVPNSSGSSGSSGGSSMPQAPSMRPVGFSTGVQPQIPPKAKEPIQLQKVFVVESDITNSQKKVAKIQNKATIQ